MKTPVPTPSATPVFASDEEALAAAEAAYAAYTEVSDAIFNEGGEQPERLAAVASGNFLKVSIEGFNDVQKQGWHSTGASTADSIELQRFDSSSDAAEIVTVYLCADVSGIDVLDSSGKSVVSSTRPDRTLFEVAFELGPSSNLLVSRREVWGDGQC